jgi:DNA-binding transcriptional LysR family regulator
MDTKFIQSLLAVVDSGSFAAAARSENLTPAAISQRVRSLEDELGIKLVARNGQTVSPSAACLSILPRLRHIASEVYRIPNDLDSKGLTGQFRIGAISTALSDRIPVVLSRLKTESSETSLIITPGTSVSLFKKLVNEELDAALMIRPPQTLPKMLSMIRLERQRFVAIVAEQDCRPLEQILRSEQVLIYDTRSWGGQPVAPWVLDHLAPGQILCELDALEAIAAAVEQGIGFGIVPEWHGLARHRKIRRIALSDVHIFRELVLVHRNLPSALTEILCQVP